VRLGSTLDRSGRTSAEARRSARSRRAATSPCEMDSAVTLLSTAGIQTRLALPDRELPPGVLRIRSSQRQSRIARLLAGDVIRGCVITIADHGPHRSSCALAGNPREHRNW
jgi:hypothetical protein